MILVKDNTYEQSTRHISSDITMPNGRNLRPCRFFILRQKKINISSQKMSGVQERVIMQQELSC